MLSNSTVVYAYTKVKETLPSWLTCCFAPVGPCPDQTTQINLTHTNLFHLLSHVGFIILTTNLCTFKLEASSDI